MCNIGKNEYIVKNLQLLFFFLTFVIQLVIPQAIARSINNIINLGWTD